MNFLGLALRVLCVMTRHKQVDAVEVTLTNAHIANSDIAQEQIALYNYA